MNMVLPVIQEVVSNRWLKAAAWLAIVLFLLSAIAQMPDVVNKFRKPYEVLDAFAVPHGWTASDTRPAAITEVRAGEELRVAYRLRRNRICTVTLDRFIRQQPSNFVVTRETMPGGATEVGEHTVVNSVRLPNSDRMPPGEYNLTTTVHNDCQEGKHSTDTPTVRFRVVS